MGSRLEFAGGAVKSSDAENGSLGHDISNRKALIRYRGSKKEYQPRRGCLEVIERNCYSSRRDLVGPAHQYCSTKYQGNLSSAIRLFVLNFYREQLELQHRQNVIQVALRSPFQALH
jgi:hypothetical protein